MGGDDSSKTVAALVPRQSSDGGESSGTDQLLEILAGAFNSQISQSSFFGALGWSIGGFLILVLLFCLLRPRTSRIYAPRAKVADDKHAPPPVGKGFFSWVDPILHVKELEMLDRLGMDATLFLRFLRMCRNIFLVLSVIGVAILIPVNLINVTNAVSYYSDVQIFMKLTPQYVTGSRFWAYVLVAYLMNGVVYFFLWLNYRAVLKLRRQYLESDDYKKGLHSRTVLIRHIPQPARSEEGIIRLVDHAKQVQDIPKTTIARNVRDLPELFEEHEDAVRELEKYLAKYIGNGTKVAVKRPLCKPSKKDRARKSHAKVDAIEYWTERIRELEMQIKQVRQTVDQRNPLPYGFASYAHIEDAHAVAYAARKKGPQNTTIRLAPKPNDLIWKNLPISRSTHRTRSIWISIWIVLLTVVYIAPNIFTSAFLANLSNLGKLWPAFSTELQRNPTTWGIIQGIAAPLIQQTFYMFLPTIFRRLLNRSGDTTKTSRERHVTSRLFSFYVFNNLIIFCVFYGIWNFIAGAIKYKRDNPGLSIWDAVKQADITLQLVISLCTISPYWITWQAQRNLAAAVDIVQAWPLIWNTFMRKCTNPTPRQMIELTAPQPFLYADYYNNYLFVVVVGLCFATIQPLILVMTALYLAIEVWLKKYLMQYVFITKVESGGLFWRMLVNRILFSVLLADCVIALVAGNNGSTLTMVWTMIPLVPILIAFKWYCMHYFDTSYDYFNTRSVAEMEAGVSAGPGAGLPERPASARRNDKVAVKFGHPALYKKLATPMVNAKAQGMLKQIYSGRLDEEDDGFDAASLAGYSDMYMSELPSQGRKRGRTGASSEPFEFVAESEMDFENFKRRPGWREEFGGEGELYGRPDDATSMGTSSRPASVMSFGDPMLAKMGAARNASPGGSSARSDSRPQTRDGLENFGPMTGAGAETTYARGYHQPLSSGGPGVLGIDSPRNISSADLQAAGARMYADDADDAESVREGRGRLLQHAAQMGGASASQSPRRKPLRSRPESPGGEALIAATPGLESGGYVQGRDRDRVTASYRYNDYSAGGTPLGEDEDDQFGTSYDYFRRPRGRGAHQQPGQSRFREENMR